VGSRVRAKVVKNKVASPFKISEFDVMYNIGINRYTDILNLAMKYEVVTKSGITISFEGVKLGVGLGSAAEFLAQNPQIMDQIATKTAEKYNARDLVIRRQQLTQQGLVIIISTFLFIGKCSFNLPP